MSEKIDKAVLNENLIKLQQGDEHAFDRVYEMTFSKRLSKQLK